MSGRSPPELKTSWQNHQIMGGLPQNGRFPLEVSLYSNSGSLVLTQPAAIQPIKHLAGRTEGSSAPSGCRGCAAPSQTNRRAPRFGKPRPSQPSQPNTWKVPWRGKRLSILIEWWWEGNWQFPQEFPQRTLPAHRQRSSVSGASARPRCRISKLRWFTFLGFPSFSDQLAVEALQRRCQDTASQLFRGSLPAGRRKGLTGSGYELCSTGNRELRYACWTQRACFKYIYIYNMPNSLNFLLAPFGSHPRSS